MRVKSGTTTRKRHQKILKLTKGYGGLRRTVYRLAKQAVQKAGVHAYTHRRTLKRDLRRLWIARINAAVKPYDLNYSRFIKLLTDNKILLDRKILANLALDYPKDFRKLVERVAPQKS